MQILCAARTFEIPRKNIFTFLKAIETLKIIKNNFSVKLIGKHSVDQAKLVKKISEKFEIDITIKQYLPRLKLLELYKETDIFVCPSIYEEFGYVILEAMAQGLPIVASKTHSFQDLIKDGENGFLVSAKNHIAFANTLKKLIEDENLRLKMGVKSYQIVKEKFDWNVLIKSYIKVYEETLY